MRSPQTLKYLCLAALTSGKVTEDMVRDPHKESILKEQPRSPVRTHASIRRPITAQEALQLYPVFRELEMKQEQSRCLGAMIQELTTTDLSQHDLKSATFHRSCVELACLFHESELYSACVDVAIDHPATHFDGLIVHLARTSLDELQVLASKLKRCAYEHRNQRPFVNRFYRPCEAFCNPESCVEYVHLANGGRVPFGF